jgi:hypothetical protein
VKGSIGFVGHRIGFGQQGVQDIGAKDG